MLIIPLTRDLKFFIYEWEVFIEIDMIRISRGYRANETYFYTPRTNKDIRASSKPKPNQQIKSNIDQSHSFAALMQMVK